MWLDYHPTHAQRTQRPVPRADLRDYLRRATHVLDSPNELPINTPLARLQAIAVKQRDSGCVSAFILLWACGSFSFGLVMVSKGRVYLQEDGWPDSENLR
jgi:hypothetical protein